jgi:cyclophilin family peptidyl-prolyl cis-trans isomerase
MVSYVEDRTKPAPAMNASGPGMMSALRDPTKDNLAQGIVKGDPTPTLWWFKGCKLEVLDEQGKVMPTAEFICHWNLDCDVKYRNRVFAEGHRCVNDRVVSISQGETEQYFPEGFAVPCANDEPWKISFQAANRTTDVHRRLKHRVTFYFIKDRDVVNPIQALYWYAPYCKVVVDHNLPDLTAEQRQLCNLCVGAGYGVDAPNDVAGGVWSDRKGRRLSGHWVVPPGVHTYDDLITDDANPGFANQKDAPWVLQAAWTHVHPMATTMSLIEVDNNGKRPIYTAKCETKLSPGLQIMHLDYLSSKEGIQLPTGPGKHYEMEVTYNNRTNQAYDSMASMGLYFRDTRFIRPDWARPQFDGKFCGLSPGVISDGKPKPRPVGKVRVPNIAVSAVDAAGSTGGAQPGAANEAAMAKVPQLGSTSLPSLKQPSRVLLNTNAGPIDIVLDPVLAPKTTAYMQQLFKSGVMDGTVINQYTPDFILRIARPDRKMPGRLPLTAAQFKLLRKLPLEIAPSREHDKYMLSMCRDKDNPSSAVGSFCIMLGPAPQLDGEYCLFGYADKNERTRSTLQKIESEWGKRDFCIERTTLK